MTVCHIWALSIGAKRRTTRHKPQRLAGAIVSPAFTCLGLTLDMVCIVIMRCVELGHTRGVVGNIFSEYLDKGGLPCRTQKARCAAFMEKSANLYNEPNPTSQIQTLGVAIFKNVDGSALSFQANAS